MKVDEIRACLKDWSRDDIVKLYTQTYRKLPKDAKEEFDEIIRSGLQKSGEKKPEKKPAKPDISALADEIGTFCSNAEEGYYFRPNREVSKKERSNWRFTAKRFIKDLSAFEPGDDAYDQSNELLCDLYDILGRATAFYTFASQDPFHAIGYETQGAFFGEICQRVHQGNVSDDSLKRLILSCCNGYVDYDTINSHIHAELIRCFCTDAELERIFVLGKKAFAPYRDEYVSSYKGRASVFVTENEIILRERYDSFCEFLPFVLILLERDDDAYEFMRREDPNINREVDLYVLLNMIPDGDRWIHVYKRAVKDGVKPRKELVEEYQRMKAGGQN